MNEIKLIVDIRYNEEKETTTYTILVIGSSNPLVRLSSIKQVADWLKDHKGGFTPDVGPKETEEGWAREASISNWAYQQLIGQQLEKAA